MTLDVDAVMNKVLAWECSILFQGKSYPIRPLELADMVMLMRLRKVKGVEESAVLQTINDLFVDPKPPLEKMTLPQFLAVIQYIMAQAQEHISKNAEAVAGLVQSAIGTPTKETSGSSLLQ